MNVKAYQDVYDAYLIGPAVSPSPPSTSPIQASYQCSPTSPQGWLSRPKAFSSSPFSSCSSPWIYKIAIWLACWPPHNSIPQ